MGEFPFTEKLLKVTGNEGLRSGVGSDGHPGLTGEQVEVEHVVEVGDLFEGLLLEDLQDGLGRCVKLEPELRSEFPGVKRGRFRPLEKVGVDEPTLENVKSVLLVTLKKRLILSFFVVALRGYSHDNGAMVMPLVLLMYLISLILS